MRRAFFGSTVTPTNPSRTAPVRVAYYFPWFDEGWEGVQAQTHYTPTLGFYDQNDPLVIQQHMEWAKYAGLDGLICIWRGIEGGPGISATTFSGVQYNTDPKLAVILDQCLQWGLKACILYEVEAYANPTAAQVTTEFQYLAANHWDHPAYLRFDGKPVVFVYTAENASNAMSTKYSTATSGFTTAYMMLQTNSNVTTTPSPAGFFTFTANRTSTLSNSYTILPGFWLGGSPTPVTTRNLATWNTNIASMIASAKTWQIVISFNEWGEGSIIEPSVELGTAYLDALHDALT